MVRNPDKKNRCIACGQLFVPAYRGNAYCGPLCKSADPDVLGRPVATLNLSVRSLRCLEKEAIQTIGELVRKPPKELMRIKNFGEASLHEIEGRIRELNLSLPPRDQRGLFIRELIRLHQIYIRGHEAGSLSGGCDTCAVIAGAGELPKVISIPSTKPEPYTDPVPQVSKRRQRVKKEHEQPEALMGRKELAGWARIGIDTVDKYMRDPKDPIPSLQFGRKFLFERQAVLEWMKRQAIFPRDEGG